jgi:PAS domain S-box-containing protein
VPARFSATINRLRAALRGKHDSELLHTLRREIEQVPAAVLVADNSTRYIASNTKAQALTGYTAAELLKLSVNDATPIPRSDEGQQLWQAFIAQGFQRGEYELRRKNGVGVPVRYWAYASVAPGVHVSLLLPVDEATTVKT